MITPLRLLEIYNSTVLTFKGKYDCVKYNFKIKTRPESLQIHNGKFAFIRLSKELQNDYEAALFVFSNLISGNQWIGAFTKEPYFRYVQVFENIDYIFEEMIKKYYGGNFKSFISSVPDMIETDDLDFINFVVIFNMLTNGKLIDRIENEVGTGLLFDDFKQKVLTYTKFFDRFSALDSERKKTLLSKIPK